MTFLLMVEYLISCSVSHLSSSLLCLFNDKGFSQPSMFGEGMVLMDVVLELHCENELESLQKA